MSDPIRPIDPLTAAAAAFGDRLLSAPADPTPRSAELLPAAGLLAIAVDLVPPPVDTLVLSGTPPLNPSLPELLAARLRLTPRSADEEEDELPADAEHDDRQERDEYQSPLERREPVAGDRADEPAS